MMRTGVPVVFGLPDSCGWVGAEPVYFEALGLPCTAGQLRAGLAVVERTAGELESKAVEYAAAAAQLRAAATTRRGILARVEALHAARG